MTKKDPKLTELLKLLGVGFGIAVTLGGTLGTGILRTPGTIAANLGNPVLIMGVWLAVSVYAVLGVLCAIELAVSIPKAGSWYVYAQRAFGDYVGFFTGITSWLGTVASLGFGAYTLSEYIVILIPTLHSYVALISIAFLILLTAFHAIGTAAGGRSQEILSLIKALGLMAFVAICFIYGSNGTAEVSEGQLNKLAEGSLFIGIIAALQGIFYTFDGWHTAAYFTEENKKPEKSLPRAMLLGVGSIIIIYLLVNLAILYVLPMEKLMVSKLAASDAVAYIFGESSGRYVSIFLLVSILGIMNTQIMMTPRTLYSMSRDGLFFKKAMHLNKGGSPIYSLLITCVLSIGLILAGKEASSRLLDVSTFYFVLSYALGFASLLMLRKKEPMLKRPFKVPFYPILPWFMLVLSLSFLLGAIMGNLINSLYALVFLFFTYPVFLLIKAKRAK